MADFEINKRLRKLIDEEYKISASAFSAKYNDKGGVKTSQVLRLRNGLSSNLLEQIAAAYPEINKTWLLTGDGEMLKTTDTCASDCRSDVIMIPLLPLAAQGGSLNDFIVSVKNDDCEKIVSPIRGVDFAMTVSGDSMDPEYPSGSKILIKRINEKAFIEWGRVYVLDTCNGSVIKKILPGSTPEAVSCVSINAHYPPFQVAFDDVYGMYRVLMLLSEK